MSGELILAFDLGTSALKVAAYDGTARVVARADRGYPLARPAPGQVEQAPDDWWRAACEAVGDLLGTGAVEPRHVAAIGITGQMCGTVPVDEHGEALAPCMTWLDARSAPQARRLVGGFPAIGGYRLGALARWLWRTNGAPNPAGHDPVSKFVWLREHRPDLWSRTACLLDAKDWLVARLTGRFTTTADCAHLTWLMDSRDGRVGWSPPLLEHVGVDTGRLPSIVGTTEVAGTLSEPAARALGLQPGIPVGAGCGDLNAAALGAGSIDPADLHAHLGSSAWVGTHRMRRRVDPITGIATIRSAVPDRHLLVAAQHGAGVALAWACTALGLTAGGTPDLEAAEAAAAQAPAGAGGAMFLPWLQGERVPRCDPDVRGGFAGLSTEHGRPELVRAVYEGVAYNLRWALDGVRRLAPDTRRSLTVVGGAARSRLWRQCLADVLGWPVATVAHPELAGCRGAAAAASVAIGRHRDLASALESIERTDALEPDRSASAVHQRRFTRFVDHFSRLRRWHRQAARDA